MVVIIQFDPDAYIKIKIIADGFSASIHWNDSWLGLSMYFYDQHGLIWSTGFMF